MTGRDPAVEAAERACSSYDVDHPRRCLETAAREALKPIRELHRPMTNDEIRDTWPGFVGVDRVMCAGCTDCDRLCWFDECETAKLIYPESELA